MALLLYDISVVLLALKIQDVAFVFFIFLGGVVRDFLCFSSSILEASPHIRTYLAVSSDSHFLVSLFVFFPTPLGLTRVHTCSRLL